MQISLLSTITLPSSKVFFTETPYRKLGVHVKGWGILEIWKIGEGVGKQASFYPGGNLVMDHDYTQIVCVGVWVLRLSIGEYPRREVKCKARLCRGEFCSCSKGFGEYDSAGMAFHCPWRAS